MVAKLTFQFVIHLVYVTILTHQQDPQFDGLSSFSPRHHSHHHHSTSPFFDSFTTSTDTPSIPRDSFRPDPDYFESDMNGPPTSDGPDGPRNGGPFIPPPPPPPPPSSPSKTTGANSLKPQDHGAGKKSHWIDRTEKKFFRNITNAQLELRKEIRNTNLRIEVVHKNVKNVRSHLFGIEVFGSIVFVAKMLIPIVRNYFLGKPAPAYEGHDVNMPPPRKPAARSRQQ